MASSLYLRGILGVTLGATMLGCTGVGSNSHPAPAAPSAANPIVRENAKPGDPSWQLKTAANGHDMEGYASATSVNRGDSIEFFVNTTDSAFDLAVYRPGWYGGAGGRLVLPAVTLPGHVQPLPTPDPTTGLVECNWQSSYQLSIPDNPADPTDWASGVYLVKLTGQQSGKQAYIMFVVRDDARTSDLLFQSSVNTKQAYNDWGGKSLYTTPRAFEVSFNRPYTSWYGSQDILVFEYDMIRFLEREGYDVTYSTDVDTHENGRTILNHKGMLVVGHDEYWSWPMRDNVEGARDKGLNVAFFAANTSYWQVRYQPSEITGAPDRTIVCYKTGALEHDPYALDNNPNNDYLITTQFRLPPVNRPEDVMVGGMYNEPVDGGRVNQDIIVSDGSSWVFAGTGVTNGSHLPGLLGYEVDQMFPNTPAGVTAIANSPYPDQLTGSTHDSNMTVYLAPSGSTVVNTGSMYWNWGVDAYTPGTVHPDLASAAAQQTTRNILNKFGAVAGTPQH